MAEKVLITGGAGFIGSNLVRGFLKEGYQVKVVDNLSTGFMKNLEDVMDQIEFVEADICDLEAMQREFVGVDYVLHHAALNSVPRSIANPIATNEADITGTLKVLVAARDAGVKRVIYSGSSSAYGDADVQIKTEDLPSNPLAPYPVAKYAAELYCKVFYKIYGLETIVFRYFNVYGPFQNPKSEYSAVIPLFITKMMNGEQPHIFGDGDQARDFTFVENNVQANLLAVKAGKEAAGEVINIACGANISLNNLVDLINDGLGTSIAPIYEPPRAGDVKDSRAGIEKAKRLLGYEPQINIEEGIKRTIAWYKNQI